MNEFTRRIKSFVRRESRLTKTQARAIEELLPKYGLDVPFKNKGPVILEIGFGNGASLLAQAQMQPENNFIGIEVHRPGVGHLLKEIESAGIENIRISCEDAVDVLHNLPDGSLHGIQLFFPDPWHKKKHHKRRLVQQHFLDLIYPKLEKGGFVHCATDWKNYAEHMLAVFNADPRFQNCSETNDYIAKPEHRITTKFEQRGIDKGHGVWDLKYIKTER
jgi:tRNA (guanine-N7-)-methyltransferase